MWIVKNLRPEEIYNDPRNYYTKEEVKRYARSNSMKKIQQRLTLKLIELLGIEEGSKVLDLGCGVGFGMEVLKAYGCEIYGIDLAEEMVKKAKEKGLRVVCGDMRELEKYFKKNTFDYVISVSALQWISKDKRSVERVSKGIHYVLKTEGKFGIQFYPFSEKELRSVQSVFSKKFVCEAIIENPSLRKRSIYLIGKKV
jgi:ubiquinone/menaquinone biosynthesis C-methylase UbiE